MAAEHDAFAREVDEELREDRLKAFWRRYGLAVIAFAVALVLGTAAWVIWEALETRQRTGDAQAFDEALQTAAAEDPAATADALAAMGADAATGYRALARFTAAQLYATAEQPAAARDTLDALAADGGAPDLYRDLARLLSIALGFDDAEPAAVIAELEPLAAPGEPWRFSARELIAAAQLANGERGAAVETLEALVEDAETPPSLRGRARELVAALGGSSLED